MRSVLGRWATILVAAATLTVLVFQGVASDPLTNHQRVFVGGMEPSSVPPPLRTTWKRVRTEQRALMGGGDLAMGAWATRDDAGYSDSCIPQSPYRTVANCPEQVATAPTR